MRERERERERERDRYNGQERDFLESETERLKEKQNE